MYKEIAITIMMETLAIRPENAEQLKAIKAVLKAMKIPFEKIKTENPYDPEFVKKIKESMQQMEEGKVTKIDIDDLWK